MRSITIAASRLTISLTMISLFIFTQPALAITAFNGQLKYGLQWFAMSSDGNGTGVEALDDNWQLRNVGSSYYDPSKPTMIYFHGWQPAANGKREGFLWEGPNGQTRRTLDNWKMAGWNVGVFFWDQFADEGTVWDMAPVWVSWAEGKIWSNNGPAKMRFKYKSGSSFVYSADSPTPADLNLPVMSTGVARWGNPNANGAQINAAIQFIYGLDPSNQSTLYSQLNGRRGGRSCEQFVEQVACSHSEGIPGAKNLCSASRPEWREAYLSKICGLPSVGDIAVLNIMRALKNQQGVVRFAGHSLGHQLATRTAMHLWFGYLHNTSANFKKMVPMSVDLLDPYATSADRSYLVRGYTAASGNSGSPKSTADRVLEYHRRMRAASRTGFEQYFTGTYYLTSQLARTPGSTHNHALISEIPSQRIFFRYFRTWNPANQSVKHTFAPKWFFATSGYLAPTTTAGNVNGMYWPYGLTAAVDSDFGYLEQIRAKNVHFAQTAGGDTFTPLDDQFAVCLKTDARFKDKKDYSCGVKGRMLVTADNTIEVWSNGVKLTVPHHDDWTRTGQVFMPNFKDGDNVIAVRARDLGGIAGLLAQVDPGLNNSVIGSNNNWRVRLASAGIPSGWNSATYHDCAWSRATQHADYGSAPWNSTPWLPGPTSSSKWIWSSHAHDHNDVLLRLNIYQFTVNGETEWYQSNCYAG